MNSFLCNNSDSFRSLIVFYLFKMPPDGSKIYGYPEDIDQVTRKLKVGVVSATHLAKRGVLFGSNDPYIKVT